MSESINVHAKLLHPDGKSYNKNSISLGEFDPAEALSFRAGDTIDFWLPEEGAYPEGIQPGPFVGEVKSIYRCLSHESSPRPHFYTEVITLTIVLTTTPENWKPEEA